MFKDVHISDSMELDDKVWPFYSLSLSLTVMEPENETQEDEMPF